MDKFASQLANLQRVASRAGGDDETQRNEGHPNNNNRDGRHRNDDVSDRRHNDRGGRNNNGGRRYNNDRDRHHSRDGARRYDHDRRYGDYNDRKRRREDDWGGDNHRRRSPGRGYHGGGRQKDGRNYERHDDRRRDDERREPHVPLSDLVKRVAEKYTSSVESCENSNGVEKRRHIALLFLTIDDLAHEHIWREWVKTGVPSEDDSNNTDEKDKGVLVSVIVHAKFPERITSPWLKQRHLLRFQRPWGAHDESDRKQDSTTQQQQQPPKYHSRRPEWGSIEITRGMIDLLEEGLRIGGVKDGNVDKDDVTEKEGGAAAEMADSNDVATKVNKHSSYRRYVSTPGEVLSSDEPSPLSDIDIPPVDRFIFVSESCLPVATLKEVEMALFGPRSHVTKSEVDTNKEGDRKKNPYDKSWVNARSTPNNGYSRQLQWNEIRPSDIPETLIWKADQWIVLNRAHGDAVASIPNKYLNGRSLWYAFRRCRASDEMYFPTALSILGIIARPSGVQEVEEGNEKCAGDQIRRRKVTYCDWSVSAKNPASFTAQNLEEVAIKARGEGCLFARKFVPSKRNGQEGNDGIVSVNDWLSLMQKLAIK